MRAAPTVSGGRVYVITLDNRVFALATDDGRRLWEHSGIQETAHLLGAASPAVAGSTVIVPYSSGEIFSMLAENGRVLWNDGLSAINRVDPIGDLAHIRGLPVIDRDVVLAVSHSGTMAAIDLRRGERVWDAELGGVQMPWVAGDFIYLLTNDSQVVCLWRRDGRIRWVRALPQFEDPEDKEDPIRWVGPVLGRRPPDHRRLARRRPVDLALRRFAAWHYRPARIAGGRSGGGRAHALLRDGRRRAGR